MIDNLWMKKQDCLWSGTAGVMEWVERGEISGAINFRTGQDRQVLRYQMRHRQGDRKTVDDAILFFLGLLQLWKTVPVVRVPWMHEACRLVCGGKCFRYRHGHNLTYVYRHFSKESGFIDKAQSIRRRPGGGNNLLEAFLEKPKSMC